jgi:hypothetical protein
VRPLHDPKAGWKWFPSPELAPEPAPLSVESALAQAWQHRRPEGRCVTCGTAEICEPYRQARDVLKAHGEQRPTEDPGA